MLIEFSQPKSSGYQEKPEARPPLPVIEMTRSVDPAQQEANVEDLRAMGVQEVCVCIYLWVYRRYVYVYVYIYLWVYRRYVYVYIYGCTGGMYISMGVQEVCG